MTIARARIASRQIAAELDGDERFVLSRSDRRLGFYRSFERALTLIPRRRDLVALCDQDDRWYPEKLATLRAELGGAKLIYSDQRLVDVDGGSSRTPTGRAGPTTTRTCSRC